MRSGLARARELALGKAEVLVEALPWISRHSGQTVVVKYGGSAMEDAGLMRQVVGDIALLALMGIRVVLVHGGGKAINALLGELGREVAFKDGLRVTDDAAMEAVQMALVGKVNQRLVWELAHVGARAVGVSGADASTLVARQSDPALGRVGAVERVDTSLLTSLLDDGYVPVVASVAAGDDGFYNVNADVAAGEVAQALGADTLVYLTDVDGFYRVRDDEDSLAVTMGHGEARRILESGTLDAGMIPKMRSIVDALDAGVGDVRILNGTFPHSILLDIFTDEGIGTMFVREGD